MAKLQSQARATWERTGPIYAVLLVAILVVAVYALSIFDHQATPSLGVVPTSIPTSESTVVAATPTSIATATSVLSPTPAPTGVVLRERDMGTWQYKLVQYGTDYKAAITYDRSSVASLEAYAVANRELANGLVGMTEPVEVLISFNQYIQPDQYRAWVASSGLSPTITGLRHTNDTNGMRATMAIMPSSGDPLPQAAIDNFMSMPHSQGDSFQGVYVVRGTIPGNLLPGLLADPTVFIVDITRTALRIDVADIVPDPSQIDIYLPEPFWSMEDLGLENFR